MHEMERLQHMLHAKLPPFQRKLMMTYQIIGDALKKDVQWSISFSGGIDSTVLLDILSHSGHRLDVHWADEGWDYPETLAFLSETERRYHFHLQRFRHMDSWVRWCEEMDRSDLAHDPQAKEAWGNPHQWDTTWLSLPSRLEDLEHRGYGGSFIGMLASESRNRTYVLKGGTRPLYQVKGERGMWHCSPLADWNKRDVWAYTASRNLPYNAVYDRLAALDIPIQYRRVGPLTCFRVMQFGSHVTLKVGWPDLYNRLCVTFPKVRAYG